MIQYRTLVETTTPAKLTTQYPPLLLGNEMSNADTKPAAEARSADTATAFIFATHDSLAHESREWEGEVVGR